VADPLRLTAIVPATNGAPTLDRCREAIEAAARPPEQILVVDGPGSAGPADARNRGARRAIGDVLVFVDADVLVHGDAFERIRAVFEAERDLTAVFGAYDDEPGGGIVSAFRNLLHHHVHTTCAGPAITFWAGLGAIRRDVFLTAGGFDSASFASPSVEDVELGRRLADAGHRILLEPKIRGKHLKRWRLGDMVRSDVFERGVPWTRLLIDRRELPSAMNLSWRHRLSAVATLTAAGALSVRRRRLLAAAVLWQVCSNRSLYALLWRRRGPFGALAGIALHGLHHLSATTGLLVAGVRWLRRHARAGERSPPG
jgi:GT2 family glycosyltransferase